MKDTQKYKVEGNVNTIAVLSSATKAEKLARDHSDEHQYAAVYSREYPGAEYMLYSSFRSGRRN